MEEDIDLGDFLGEGEEFKQNPNEIINNGSSKEIKPVFTKSPLPDELLFDGYENFLNFLPCFGYYDEEFCYNVLPRNYKKSLSIIEKQINISNENIDKYTSELHDIENTNLVPEKSKLNYLNSKYNNTAPFCGLVFCYCFIRKDSDITLFISCMNYVPQKLFSFFSLSLPKSCFICPKRKKLIQFRFNFLRINWLQISEHCSWG